MKSIINDGSIPTRHLLSKRLKLMAESAIDDSKLKAFGDRDSPNEVSEVQSDIQKLESMVRQRCSFCQSSYFRWDDDDRMDCRKGHFELVRISKKRQEKFARECGDYVASEWYRDRKFSWNDPMPSLRDVSKCRETYTCVICGGNVVWDMNGYTNARRECPTMLHCIRLDCQGCSAVTELDLDDDVAKSFVKAWRERISDRGDFYHSRYPK